MCLVPQWCQDPRADRSLWLPAGLRRAGRRRELSRCGFWWKQHPKPTLFPMCPDPNPWLVRKTFTFSAIAQMSQFSVRFSEPSSPLLIAAVGSAQVTFLWWLSWCPLLQLKFVLLEKSLCKAGWETGAKFGKNSCSDERKNSREMFNCCRSSDINSRGLLSFVLIMKCHAAWMCTDQVTLFFHWPEFFLCSPCSLYSIFPSCSSWHI